MTTTRKQHEETSCPNCKKLFIKRRSDQKFCSERCRKDKSKKLLRKETPANSRNSVSKRRDNTVLFDKALRLAEELYTLPKDKRLGYMKDLIDQARNGNSMLRQILSNQRLLFASKKERIFYHRRCPASYYTIAQAADRYCKMFWNSGVKDVVYGKGPEPPTGEIL